MLDDSPPVASWFDNHLESVIGFLILVAGIVTQWAWMGATQKQHGKEIGKLDKRVSDNEECLDGHRADTSRHIDPVRDERRWSEMRDTQKDMQQQLARIEASLLRRSRQ
jgi:hypothetical protein